MGCKFCSFPEEDESETERAGRWKGTPDTCGECGIHTQPLRDDYKKIELPRCGCGEILSVGQKICSRCGKKQ